MPALNAKSYRACPEPAHPTGGDRGKQLRKKARKGKGHETQHVHDGALLRHEGEPENAYSIFSGAFVLEQGGAVAKAREGRKE